MKRSAERILTSHCGSLPRPRELLAPLHAKDGGDPYDADDLARRVRASVREVVRKQAEIGIDVVDDGEHSKSSFAHYARARIGGLERRNEPQRYLGTATRDSLAFPGVYEEMRVMFAARADKIGKPRGMQAMVCAGPIKYIGHKELAADIDNLKSAVDGLEVAEAFITAISPTNLEMYLPNEYYRSEEEYLVALAEAMNEEYRTIVDAGFLLQIDDPRLITYYNRTPGISLADNRKFMALRVEIVNHALRGIPEDRVRFHTCYSVNVAPRIHDLELEHYVDLMLTIRAQTYSFEASNPRHEHEYEEWGKAKMADDKILIPGVITQSTVLVEHPELVAQRLERFAGVVGKERVIAGADCGFASFAGSNEVHPSIVWAKFESLVEGSRIASKKLWGK